MKICKSCQKEIDSKATKCPFCQTDQRNWFRKHPIITVIMVIIVIGIVGGNSKNNNSSNSKTTASQSSIASESKITPTPVTISVKELADDFDLNQVSAENKWKDKYVEFTAKISNITDSGLSFTNIASKEFSLTQISCLIVDKNQLMPLKNGQTVKVSGIIGNQTIGVIGLSKCEVIQ